MTRKEAIATGSTRYFTGRPCKYGHVCERLTGCKTCVECHRRRVHERVNSTRDRRTAENNRLRGFRKSTPEKRAAENKRGYRLKAKAKLTPVGQLISRLRRGLHRSLSGNAKPNRTIVLIGCSLDYLRDRFERAMVGTAMSFDDRSSWHIDHVRPIASFDHSDPEQVRTCWHWTNLQPLSPADNIAKGARL